MHTLTFYPSPPMCMRLCSFVPLWLLYVLNNTLWKYSVCLRSSKLHCNANKDERQRKRHVYMYIYVRRYPPDYTHVWIDTHVYHVFDTFRLSKTPSEHLEFVCTDEKPQIAKAPLSTLVGEWSLATTDCAKWLNGYNTSSRSVLCYFLKQRRTLWPSHHPWD